MSEHENNVRAKLAKDFPFTQVSNECLDNLNLSWRAKGLYSFLLSKATIEGWRFSKSRLIKQAKEGRDALTVAIDELRKAGYLEMVPRREEGGTFSGYDWILHFVSQITEKPECGKTGVREIRAPVNQYSINNTENNNTENNNTEKELAPKKKALASSDKDSRVKAVLDWYADFYGKVFKVKPTIAFGKVGSLVKARLKALDSEGYEPDASIIELKRITGIIITNAAKGTAKYPFDGKTSLEMVLAGNVWDAARRELGQGRRTAVVPEATKAINPNIGCLEGRELQGKRIEETLSLRTEE